MSYLNDNLKRTINMLQFHIDRESDYILLIFDTEQDRMKYIKSLKTVVVKEKHITMGKLYEPNTLDGLRYRAFYFVTDENVNKLESQV